MRVDFNVPMNNGEIIDSTRILNVLPTITYLIKNNNSVILLSHLGRPQKKSDEYSLAPIHKKLVEILNCPVFFCDEIIGKEAEKKKRILNPGEVLLLENIRFFHEEKKYKNEEEYEKNMFFAKKIAQQMDFFINEAFACSHRESTSIKLLPMCFPNKKLAGFLMENEVSHLRKIKHNSLKPEHVRRRCRKGLAYHILLLKLIRLYRHSTRLPPPLALLLSRQNLQLPNLIGKEDRAHGRQNQQKSLGNRV